MIYILVLLKSIDRSTQKHDKHSSVWSTNKKEKRWNCVSSYFFLLEMQKWSVLNAKKYTASCKPDMQYSKNVQWSLCCTFFLQNSIEY